MSPDESTIKSGCTREVFLSSATSKQSPRSLQEGEWNSSSVDWGSSCVALCRWGNSRSRQLCRTPQWRVGSEEVSRGEGSRGVPCLMGAVLKGSNLYYLYRSGPSLKEEPMIVKCNNRHFLQQFLPSIPATLPLLLQIFFYGFCCFIIPGLSTSSFSFFLNTVMETDVELYIQIKPSIVLISNNCNK